MSKHVNPHPWRASSGVRKVCSKCGDTKMLENFDRDKGARDGHASECRTCADVRRSVRDYERPAYVRRWSA